MLDDSRTRNESNENLGEYRSREEVSSVGSQSVSDDIEFDINYDKNEERIQKKKARKEISFRPQFWDHFEKFIYEIDKVQKAKCKYCGRELKADPRLHGTRSLKNHFESCKMKPQDLASCQTRLSIQSSRVSDKEGQLVPWKFDQDKSREAICRWLIIDELPFKTIENSDFRHLMSIACPMLLIPSQRTITKDIYNMYINERAKLKSFIKAHSQTICITTDTWTSIQRVNYMCLTAHFIDDRWKLQKQVLNFYPISGHKGEEIGKGVEKYLLDWGINKIFTITIDNASANDSAISYLRKKFDNWGTNILAGKYVHMRCIAHIVNLIVQDGLKGKEEHLAISRIITAIRYVRNSPARYKNFLECVELEKCESKKLLSLDVPTRWNSTYLMLDSAKCLQKAFNAYVDADLAYVNDLSKSPYDGVPTEDDWVRVELFLKFLAHFYKLTLSISGSSYVTCNTVFHEICSVHLIIKDHMQSEDKELKQMAEKMDSKYDKYWGSIDNMNMILFYAVILDPRHKLEFIEFSFDTLYGVESLKSKLMKKEIRNGMEKLFNDYKVRYRGPPGSPLHFSSSSSSCVSLPSLDSTTSSSLYDQYKKRKRSENRESVKSELEKYCGEQPEDDSEAFDILNWWKVNSPRFPILSKLARDILAVPISTVASESTFSTGGRVLDPFRSSLSPKIVQALVCAQDWLRMGSKPISVEEDLNELENIEKELLKAGVDSTIIDI